MMSGDGRADEEFGKHEGTFGESHETGFKDSGLELGEEERLPWLESADDIEPEADTGGRRRLIVAGVVAVLVLALAVDGIYWLTHREAAPAAADGSLIEASKDPYKIAPTDPGGKTFQGTGDTSFKVSQGEHPNGSIAGNAGTTPPPAAPSATPGPAATPSSEAKKEAAHEQPHPAAQAGGIAVQIGAYSSNALAEAAWNRQLVAHEALKTVNHRIVEGKADIGTVYRLQAMAPDLAAANSLCSHLQGEGLKCQVKR